MTSILAITTQTVMAMTINFLIILAIIILPLLACARVSKWNRDRDKKLDQISQDLKEIKQSLKKQSD